MGDVGRGHRLCLSPRRRRRGGRHRLPRARPVPVGRPAVAGLGDRVPRAIVLFGAYAAQAILFAATALALLAGPAPLVYLLAVLSATVVSLSRPVHSSLMPEVVEGPDELTAANVVSGMAESSGSLLGPLGAGILITIRGPELVFVATSALTLVAALLIAGQATRAFRHWRTEPVPEVAPSIAAPPDGDGLREALAGLRAIRADDRLRSVVAVAVWATFLVGALDIFYAVLAIDLLGLGDGGVGMLGAIGGSGDARRPRRRSSSSAGSVLGRPWAPAPRCSACRSPRSRSCPAPSPRRRSCSLRGSGRG